MRAENNTWEHYQDNKVEWLLGDTTRAHLNAYAQAGVVAVLFGRGADGPTCACDAAGDGVTNPAPINGNTGVSLNADDDGGYFKQQAVNYYAAGPALSLPPALECSTARAPLAGGQPLNATSCMTQAFESCVAVPHRTRWR